MRSRFWLWTALLVFGAACGLDPQPTLPRATETDSGEPGPGALPPGGVSGSDGEATGSDSAGAGGDGEGGSAP